MIPIELRTSDSSPLRIDEVSLIGSRGIIGLTLCPGKWDRNGDVIWRRDLVSDLEIVKRWGASAVVTLMESFEFKLLRVEGMPRLIEELGMAWIHLPIRDGDIPDMVFETNWTATGDSLRQQLQRGERIMIHCRGGMGRTGTIAARILIENGMAPIHAIETIRHARSGAIEPGLQERYVLDLPDRSA